MSGASIPTHIETEVAEIHRIFELQQANQYKVARSTVSQRKAKLTKLHRAVLKYRTQIQEALYKDYRKHPSEVDLTEIYAVTTEIKHAKRHLKQWMRGKTVETPWALFGASSRVHYEPKGVVLIISPWNFPINLSFGPLVGAIAAGNTVIIKPSEHTPHAAALMQQIIAELFDENEVAIIPGGISTSKELLQLPFNHIFFTGSSNVGKIVMRAAAENLTSVTLELGGKSPSIIDETANVKLAAHRIAWAKFLNNGQICIAPDYIFVHKSKQEAFVAALKENVEKFYQGDASKADGYCRVVNTAEFHRLKGYVDEAISKGAKLAVGGEFDENQNYISPTILTNLSKDAAVMQHEIFGPVLPIFTYTNIEQVLDEINKGEKPLALYIYSKRNKNIKYILENTRAGGTCINHNAIHYFNPNLPFGGSNHSGLGKGHGKYFFEAFSNARSILRQYTPSAIDLLSPPFNNLKQRLIDFTIKWL